MDCTHYITQYSTKFSFITDNGETNLQMLSHAFLLAYFEILNLYRDRKSVWFELADFTWNTLFVNAYRYYSSSR